MNAADKWNKEHPVGTMVTLTQDNGKKVKTVTSSPAKMITPTVAGIYLSGFLTPHSLDRVEVR